MLNNSVVCLSGNEGSYAPSFRNTVTSSWYHDGTMIQTTRLEYQPKWQRRDHTKILRNHYLPPQMLCQHKQEPIANAKQLLLGSLVHWSSLCACHLDTLRQYIFWTWLPFLANINNGRCIIGIVMLLSPLMFLDHKFNFQSASVMCVGQHVLRLRPWLKPFPL